uniref:Uncharacterized protein n=1 Tax=Solanum tuberosum TaxID=4113 RepID=M1BW48_SOLTU
MKNLGVILRERKEKDAQEKGQEAGTTQLGMVGLCRAIAKQKEKPGNYSMHYVDISINGRPARAMVDSGAEANIMTKMAAARLGLSYNPSNTRLKTVHVSPTPVCGVAQGVSITLGKWQGNTNFTVAPLDIFDIILRQEFFQMCHMMIDPYLQRLMVMEQEGSYRLRRAKVKGHAQLSAIQIAKGLKKAEPTFIATTASSKEDNGAKESFPPCMEKVLEENNVMMPEEPSRRLPPKKEVDHKTELEEIRKQLRELHKGIDRVNGLLVAHTKRQDLVVHAAM